jgi:hypothetical protein
VATAATYSWAMRLAPIAADGSLRRLFQLTDPVSNTTCYVEFKSLDLCLACVAREFLVFITALPLVEKQAWLDRMRQPQPQEVAAHGG